MTLSNALSKCNQFQLTSPDHTDQGVGGIHQFGPLRPLNYGSLRIFILKNILRVLGLSVFYLNGIDKWLRNAREVLL